MKRKYCRALIVVGLLFMLLLNQANIKRTHTKQAPAISHHFPDGLMANTRRLPVAGVAAAFYNHLELVRDMIDVELTDANPREPESYEAYTLWLGWTRFESGGDSWSQVGGDNGHAYGRYQFDDRHCLAEFFRYCVNTDPDNYEAFTTFYYVDSKGKAHIKNTELITRDWRWICFLQGEEFHAMQTKFAVEYYYRATVNSLLESGIEIEGYSPILHGTILSLAIRDGIYASDLAAIIDTYYPGIDEETWLIRIYSAESNKHPDQSERWIQNQMEAALSAVADYAASPNDINVLDRYDIETIQL